MRILSFLAVVFFFAACKKDELDISAYYNCHQSLQMDSLQVHQKLIGAWRWQKQFCFWTAKTTKADSEVVATFSSNGSFEVKENSLIESQGTWSIQRPFSSNNMWELNLSSRSIYLPGYILFCGNEVVFHHSYIDGCDKQYVRVQ